VDVLSGQALAEALERAMAEGAPYVILVPFKIPAGNQELDADARTRNALLRDLRCRVDGCQYRWCTPAHDPRFGVVNYRRRVGEAGHACAQARNAARRTDQRFSWLSSHVG
jgi:hypothetical protein